MTAYALDPLRDSRHRNAAAAREQADWLQYLLLGNKAARTRDSYERYTAALLRAFPQRRFEDFTDGDLAHVLAQYPPRSRHIAKAAMNNWFKWGRLTRRIAGNPVELLPEMRYRADRSYDLYTAAEIDALCAIPSPDGQLLTIMFWAGIRRAEAIHMTGKRLDLERRQILVTDGAKGSKSRIVPMIGRVAVAAADLLMLEGIGPDEFLWYTKPGGRRFRRVAAVSNGRFDAWWREVHVRASVRRRKPHTTRHTFATRMRELGLEMEEIQHLLGHESIRTTSDTYIHANLASTAARMREAVGDPA